MTDNFHTRMILITMLIVVTSIFSIAVINNPDRLDTIFAKYYTLSSSTTTICTSELLDDGMLYSGGCGIGHIYGTQVQIINSDIVWDDNTKTNLQEYIESVSTLHISSDDGEIIYDGYGGKSTFYGWTDKEVDDYWCYESLFAGDLFYCDREEWHRQICFEDITEEICYIDEYHNDLDNPTKYWRSLYEDRRINDEVDR